VYVLLFILLVLVGFFLFVFLCRRIDPAYCIAMVFISLNVCRIEVLDNLIFFPVVSLTECA